MRCRLIVDRVGKYWQCSCMTGMTLLDALAISYFLAAWLGYHLYLERSRRREVSLHTIMDGERTHWMQSMLARDNRIIDAQIMASLQNGTAFFASTSLIAIGGAITLLRAPDDLIQVFGGFDWGTGMGSGSATRTVWEVKVIGLAVIFTYAFFKFSWSYRLFNYGAILMGAVPPTRDEEAQRLAERAARMNIVAGRHFNRGQRAFFYALAYLGWFVGALPLILATSFVLVVMWRRHFASDALKAMQDP
jgi:uncharacterized membrane protein